jgi:hypothetical protein
MKRSLSALFAGLGWFAVITQYVLMLQNATAPLFETTVRFLSFFTILTNTLLAAYYTIISVSSESTKINRPGTLTALTVYITIVGLVYQVMLRHIWSPQGLQRVVDELLHSVIPLCTIVYWILFEKKDEVRYSQISSWLIYPAVYFIYILIRGFVSDFYPYPFVDVNVLGYTKVIINAFTILFVFVLTSVIFVRSRKAF